MADMYQHSLSLFYNLCFISPILDHIKLKTYYQKDNLDNINRWLPYKHILTSYSDFPQKKERRKTKGKNMNLTWNRERGGGGAAAGERQTDG